MRTPDRMQTGDPDLEALLDSTEKTQWPKGWHEATLKTRVMHWLQVAPTDAETRARAEKLLKPRLKALLGRTWSEYVWGKYFERCT
jgi:hypothetical protein